MQRPVMDPMFLEAPRDGGGGRWWSEAATRSSRVMRWVGRQLLSRPLRRRRRVETGEPGTPLGRFVRGLAYRLLFAPVLLAGLVGTLVYLATHPPTIAGAADRATDAGARSADGIYQEPVRFSGEDGTPLRGWLVPAVDARRVLLHRDRLLRQRCPAVVLAHDFGRGDEQVLPLAGPLHEAGIVIVTVGLRGVGAGPPRGQTFGLNEAGDVAAAVQLLRGRAFVDANRIGVIGIGAGANAALLAAERDGSIRAVVAADAEVDADALVARYLGPNRTGLRWMRTLSAWMFEASYHVDLDALHPRLIDAVAGSRPLLRLDGQAGPDGRLTPAATEAAADFCRAHLGGSTME